MRSRVSRLAPLIPVIAAVAVGCAGIGGGRSGEVPNGDPKAGHDAIGQLGCGGCHDVPGVAGADGRVAPPLTAFAERGFIAGRVANEWPSLVQWILDPHSIDPETAMPDVGATEEQARDIAAYLYTLD